MSRKKVLFGKSSSETSPSLPNFKYSGLISVIDIRLLRFLIDLIPSYMGFLIRPVFKEGGQPCPKLTKRS